jgi:hypothetical protein
LSVILLVALWMGLGQQAPANIAALDCPPHDDAVRHSDLVAFRASLQKAVARRDAAAILQMTDPNIRTSFGPNDGFAFFERDLRNKDSEIWNELAFVLSGGGSFETPERFVAPFWFGCGEPGEVVVVGAGVRARSRPSDAASVVAVVSYAILKGSEPDGPNSWAQVELKDGRHGFVAARFVRSPIGYRAHFAKTDGSWRLVAFIAGD